MRHFAPFFVFSVLFSISAFADEETATPIPFWERPDYVLESPDVIEIKVMSDTIPMEKLTGINGTHLIGPDGFILLVTASEKSVRIRVQDMTIAESEEAVAERLAKNFDPDSFEVRIKVYACNSKEFRVVFMSEEHGPQTLAFPFTGHETVTKAIECCNGLAPGSSRKLLVLRASKGGKPIEMFDVCYDETVNDPKKDMVLQAGDTVLIRQDFRGEDLRPDGPVTSMPDFSGGEGMMVSEADYDIPPFELDEAQTKTASQVAVPTTVPIPTKKSKRIARTVFFDGEAFDTEHYFGSLSPLTKTIKSEASISCIFQSGSRKSGFWLILYGDEETVTELHAVFKEIADGK